MSRDEKEGSDLARSLEMANRALAVAIYGNGKGDVSSQTYPESVRTQPPQCGRGAGALGRDHSTNAYREK